MAIDEVLFSLSDDTRLNAALVDAAHPIPFPLRSTVTVQTKMPESRNGQHRIEILLETRPFGNLHLIVEDVIEDKSKHHGRIPHDEVDDLSPAIIERRRAVIEEVSGDRS